jgi:hypothetical protein
VQLSGDRDYLYRLGPTEWVLPEDGDRIQSTKFCVLNKNRTTNNFQKHNIFIHSSHRLSNAGTAIKTLMTPWAGYILHIKERRTARNILADKSEVERPFRGHRP